MCQNWGTPKLLAMFFATTLKKENPENKKQKDSFGSVAKADVNIGRLHAFQDPFEVPVDC